MFNNRYSFFFLIFLCGIYFSAWFFQHNLFMNWDVSYLLNAARMLMAGGTYLEDFFTPNLPIILYLYMPPLLAQQFFHIDLVLGFRLYIFILATVSLGFCAYLSNKIFTDQDSMMKEIVILMLAVVFFIIPFYDFGQREHLLIILSLPYLLLVVYRLSFGALTRQKEILIGLLAGLGFAIKPQFFIIPLLIEGYYSLEQKKYLAWLRPEVIAMLIVLLVHMIVAIVFYPDYISIVAPYMLRNYYNSIGSSWHDLLSNNLAIFGYCAVLFYFVQYPVKTYKALCIILLLALLGSLLSYFSQRTTFYYHLLPVFSLSLLLITVLFSQLVLRADKTYSIYGCSIFMGLLMIVFLLYQAKTLWTLLLFSPLTIFSFFGIFFTVLWKCFQTDKSFLKITCLVCLILLWGYGCFYVARGAPYFSSHVFLITVFILITSFGLFSQGKNKALVHHILLATLGTLLFIYPVFFSYGIYWRSVGYKNQILYQLVKFIKMQLPYQSIYVFSLAGNYSSPLFEYANRRLAQRFDCLWPTLGFIKQAAIHAETLSPQYFRDKNFFLNLIADDFYLRKPNIVLIDRRDQKLQTYDPHFDYVAFFSENEKFRQVWKAYHYLTQLEAFPYYKLDVYTNRT